MAKYESDKERLAKQTNQRAPKYEGEYMGDAAYRRAMHLILTTSDAIEVLSMENSQDASSNFNTKKDIQEQLEDLTNLK